MKNKKNNQLINLVFKIDYSFSKLKNTRSAKYQQKLLDSASLLLKETTDLNVLQKLEKSICSKANRDNFSIGTHLCVKLAISKIKLDLIVRKTNISVIVPIYHETARCAPNSQDKTIVSKYPRNIVSSPSGEDLVVQKNKQVEWLTHDNGLINIKTIFVDDGCDRGSGEVVDEIIKLNNLKNQSVLFLEKHLTPNSKFKKILSDFSTPKDSQKAGAIYLGLAHSVDDNDDISIYCDADLSYNLGLIGNLIEPIVSGNADFVTVNRRDPLSILEEPKKQNSADIGKKRTKTIIGSIRSELFGHLIPADTQPGFKAFRTSTLVNPLLQNKKERNFSFDIQLLARTSKHSPNGFKTIPIVCLDSSQETTADSHDTYIEMLKTFLRLANELQIRENKILSFLKEICENEIEITKQIWKELELVLGSKPNSQKDNFVYAAYDKDLIIETQKYFVTKGNNTASSVPMSGQMNDNLNTLILDIKKQVRYKNLPNAFELSKQVI